MTANPWQRARTILTVTLALVLLTTFFSSSAFAEIGEEAPDEPAPAWEPNDEVPPGGFSTDLPLWERARAEGAAWTIIATNVITTSASALLDGTNDIDLFCPAYSRLSRSERVNFWVYLTSAITKYESGFSPTARYLESTLGTDPITGRPVYSEGLLQLSYQDQLAYPFCNEFDWNIDKRLKPTDPNKTIFDAEKNLGCGLKILDQQVRNQRLIAYDRGQYWAVLKPKSKYSRVTHIQALTRAMPMCAL